MLSVRPEEGRLRTNMAFAKTPGRENANRGLLMTVHGKGKHTQNSLAQLQPHSVQPTRTKSLHLIPATEKKPGHLKPRPLGDKTPFPNREPPSFVTPLPGDQKIAKLVLEAKPQPPAGTTPASAPRPSSARTHVRAPRNSSGRKPGFDAPIEAPNFSLTTQVHNHLAFQTPATNGRPWDVSPLAPSPVPLPVPEPEEQDDYDEVEYMPPKVDVEATWVPPLDFELPDYAEVGREMRRRAMGWAYDDEVPLEIVPAVAMGEGEVWEMPVLEQPELDPDDPFVSASSTKQQRAPIPIATKTRRSLVAVGAMRAAVATTAATSGFRSTRLPAPSTSSRAAVAAPRPGTATRPTAAAHTTGPGAAGGTVAGRAAAVVVKGTGAAPSRISSARAPAVRSATASTRPRPAATTLRTAAPGSAAPRPRETATGSASGTGSGSSSATATAVARSSATTTTTAASKSKSTATRLPAPTIRRPTSTRPAPPHAASAAAKATDTRAPTVEDDALGVLRLGLADRPGGGEFGEGVGEEFLFDV